jgi:hypothetical protein
MDFFQTQTHVTLSILARDADASRSRADVSPDGLAVAVSLALPSSTDFVADVHLFAAVVPGSVKLKVSAYRTEVQLEKAESARFAWPALERGADAPAPTPASAAFIAAPVAGASAVVESVKAASASGVAVGGGVPGGGSGAATTASSGGSEKAAAPPRTKDWSALERELAAEEEPAGEGEEALMSLFRGIFAKGDEATQRAMVKSFQTSGGTVLSTNWGEVEKTDYEKNIKPPEGVDFKKAP